MPKPREYIVWKGMRQRCLSPTCWAYKWYGARGIKICDRWSKFSNFLADMGPRPSPEMTIERINNERGYEPGNCKWVHRSEQSKNRRCVKPTHCPQGHEFTPDNTYISKKGYRFCRACHRASGRARRILNPEKVREYFRRYQRELRARRKSSS